MSTTLLMFSNPESNNDHGGAFAAMKSRPALRLADVYHGRVFLSQNVWSKKKKTNEDDER